MSRVPAAVLIASLVLSSAAFANTIIFNSPTGDITATHTYVFDGANIIATGWDQSGTPGHLFGKVSLTGNENGIGLNDDPSGDGEIWFKSSTLSSKDFIQLDFTDLFNKGFTGFQFEMNSTTDSEKWQVAACSVSGTLCSTGAVTGTTQGTLTNVPLNFDKNHPFLDFTSISSYGGTNVLLEGIAATPTPEPRFYGVLLVGILSLAAIAFRKRRAVARA